MNYQCKFCLINSFEKSLSESGLSEIQKDELTDRFFNYLTQVEKNVLTPVVAREIHELFYEYTGVADPHFEKKKFTNQFVLEHYESLKKRILNSDNPFETALRIAIAGNIIDLAACPEVFDDLEDYFQKTIMKVLESDFAIDDSKELEEKINSAKKILYLGDNAGEAVLDKLFLEILGHPNIYFAVRGGPVLNDLTFPEAEELGIGQYARIISNGYNAPSTILDQCSGEFQEIFNTADLIIAKGQGNLEGLMNNHNKNIFFLLMVKCKLIGKSLGVHKGDFVVKRNN